MVGMIGQHYEDSHVAAGFGQQMARPLFREQHTDDMSEEDARTLIESCLRVCVMRDKSMINKFQIAKVGSASTGINTGVHCGVYTGVNCAGQTWGLEVVDSAFGFSA